MVNPVLSPIERPERADRLKMSLVGLCRQRPASPVKPVLAILVASESVIKFFGHGLLVGRESNARRKGQKLIAL